MWEHDLCDACPRGHARFKLAKTCRATCCARRNQHSACSNGSHPSCVLRTGCTKALRRNAKGNRCLEVPRLSAHETIGGLRLVFSEIGCIADRTKEYSEQKTAVATAAAGKASHQGELTRARSRLIGCSSRPINVRPLGVEMRYLAETEMSAIGPKQRFPLAPHMSAFGGKADMPCCTA